MKKASEPRLMEVHALTWEKTVTAGVDPCSKTPLATTSWAGAGTSGKYYNEGTSAKRQCTLRSKPRPDPATSQSACTSIM